MSYNISLRDDPPPPCPECAALRHERDCWAALAAAADADKLKAEADLAAARAESGVHYNRVASLLFSDALRDAGTTCEQVRAWESEYIDAKSELAAARERSHHIETQATQIAVDKDNLANDLAAERKLLDDAMTSRATLKAELAHPAPPQTPMTEALVREIFLKVCEQLDEPEDISLALARAVERHHGIGPARGE